MKKYLVILTLIFLTACEDSNSVAKYGKMGLPVNCRAIIQENINRYEEIKYENLTYEERMYEIDGVMDSISRNCGAYGYAWDD